MVHRDKETRDDWEYQNLYILPSYKVLMKGVALLCIEALDGRLIMVRSLIHPSFFLDSRVLALH